VDVAAVDRRTQCLVDHLVPLDERDAFERGGHHTDLEVVAGPGVVAHFRDRPGDVLLDSALDLGRAHVGET